MSQILKKSFERRLKRLGIITSSVEEQRRLSNKKYFERFKGLPFWIWDKTKHTHEYDRVLIKSFYPSGSKKVACCFKHAIGLPQKDGKPKPLFDYEHLIFNELQNHNKHLWIKKATGLGITEFMLRYIAWLCIHDDKLKGSQMCFVTGPRIELAITLIDRLKRLFPSIVFDDKETVIELNGCHIEAYPSHHLDAMRGLKDVKLILLDEADFFPPGQQQDARDVSERYIAKSDPYIVMVSTPNGPGQLFATIEREPDDVCLYKRLRLDYHYGLNKIYTLQEIEAAKQSPSFEREYNLQYGFGTGNVFSHVKIDACVKLGEDERYKDTANPYAVKALGIDPGYSNSRFAFVLTQLGENNVAQLLFSDQYERPLFQDMVDHTLELLERYSDVHRVYVDGSNVPFITALKQALNERTDYLQYIAELKREWKVVDVEEWLGLVIPVNFSTEHKQLLAHAKMIVDNEQLAIPAEFDKLILALRTAVAQDGVLDKAQSVNHDLLDALRLSLRYFVLEQ